MWGKREFLTANDKDFSLALEMTIRESDVSQSPVPSHQSLATSHQQLVTSN